MNQSHSSHWRRDMALLFLATALLFCIGLGARAYLTPSEARYIEIPRQMLASGDWLTPHINGVPYFEKPPLFYWLQAAIMSLGGLGEFSGRLATVLIVATTTALTYAGGRLLYSRLAGLLAGFAFATCIMSYILGHSAMLDAPVTLFITATLVSFIAAQKTGQKTSKGARFYYAMYAAAALAILTKGLIGIVIPGMIIFAWIGLTKNWKMLKDVRLFSGTLLFLAIAAPWHIYMANAHPEFLNFYFVHEHFERFTSDVHKRTAPWWFFIAVTIVGIIPWGLLLPAACRGSIRSNPGKQFLLLWALLPLIFFSASHSKLLSYIYPIFPPLFILIGAKLSEMWNAETAPRLLRHNARVVAAIFTLAIAAYEFLLKNPKTLGAKLGPKFDALPVVPPFMLYPFMAVLLILLLVLVGRSRPKYLIVAIGAVGFAFGLTTNYIAPLVDSSSIRPLVEQIAPKLQDGDAVVAYNSYWQDLPVYLNHNITVVGWLGELEFGVSHYPETQNWMIADDIFWQGCKDAPGKLFIFIREKDFETLPTTPGCSLRKIGSEGNTLLLQREAP